MLTLCPAPHNLRAAFASVIPGPPEENPLLLERIVAIATDNHDEIFPLVIDDTDGASTGLAPATDFDAFLGVMWSQDEDRQKDLYSQAIEYRKENVNPI